MPFDSGRDLTFFVDKAREDFVFHMDDDLNSPRAMASVFDLVAEVEETLGEGEVNRESADLFDGFFDEINEVLGIFYTLPEDDVEEDISEEIQALADERQEVRAEKDWAKADEIRDKLTQLGYAIEDTSEGPVVRKL